MRQSAEDVIFLDSGMAWAAFFASVSGLWAPYFGSWLQASHFWATKLDVRHALLQAASSPRVPATGGTGGQGLLDDCGRGPQPECLYGSMPLGTWISFKRIYRYIIIIALKRILCGFR